MATTRIRLAACILAAVPLATSLAVALPAADAAPSPHLHVVNVLSKKFVAPLQFAVSGHHVYVADALTSTLTEIGGKVLAHGPDPNSNGDIAGVAVNRHRHEIAYTSSNGNHTDTRLTVLKHGQVAWSANLARFEAANNPDHKVLYGIDHPTKCQRNGFTKAHIPARYHGAVDSHPYAVTPLRHGAWAVADAGGNDLLRVTADGDVHVIRIFPRETMVVTQDTADAEHLPQCVVGVHYHVEAVPTDVERGGKHGALYVSTLPGADAANMGRVYRVHSGTGKRTLIGAGFNEATNLAVTKRGTVLVAELGAGRISRITGHHPVEVASLSGVVAVERANGRWYASTAPAVNGAQEPGRVVVLGT